MMHPAPRSPMLLLLCSSLLLGGPLALHGQDGANQSEAPAAENGRIVGRVLDAANGEVLRSAQVSLPALGIGGLTSLDGRYVLRDVPPGTWELQVQMMGFGSKTVTGVQVQAGRTAVLDVRLDPQAVALEGLTVSASAERGTTTSLLTERRRSSIVSDAIGRDQMARSPDGNAAAALKRVPGLTVMEGKFAYIRGLGERYSATTLNGAPLASPVPDRKVIPLDLFPSELLESIVTSKTFSPEQSGDQAGGLVELRTRNFPANRLVSVSLGTSWSGGANLGSGLNYARPETPGLAALLGLGDVRGLPAEIPRDVRVSRASMSSDELASLGRSFGGDWGPRDFEIPLNSSASITYGDDFDFSDSRRLGFIASVNHSTGYTHRGDQVERVFQGSSVEDPEVDYAGDATTRSIQWGALLNTTFQPASGSQVTVSGMFNHMADHLARRLEGFNLDSNTNQLNTRIQSISTSLLNAQLKGEHVLPFLNDGTLSWRGAYTAARRYEPSTREMLYRQTGETFVFDDFVQSGSIFHQDQRDEGWNGALSQSLPFDLGGHRMELHVGAATDRKDRETFTRRFRFRPVRGGELTDEALALPPNDLLVPENIGPGRFELEESTFRTDNYDASETVDAAFVRFQAEAVGRLRLDGGVRVERVEQSVDPRDLFDTGLPPVDGAELEATDVLPAVNATLEMTESANLRAGYSRTLARPQLRELAPFSFADYAGGYLQVGNPTLDLSRIDNFDVRMEWFPTADGVLSVGGFYKRFDRPIEVLVLPSTELIKSWVNAPSALNYGVELEVRTDLGAILDPLRNVSFNGNLTLVESDVDAGGTSTIFIPESGPTVITTVDRKRALQGQSPWIVNAGLTWSDPLSGASAALLFNRFGRRIDAVGREATPDIYEEARSQLDMVVEVPFKGWSVKLAAGRLLGNEVEYTQAGALLRGWDLGRTLSLGIGWKPFR